LRVLDNEKVLLRILDESREGDSRGLSELHFFALPEFELLLRGIRLGNERLCLTAGGNYLRLCRQGGARNQLGSRRGRASPHWRAAKPQAFVAYQLPRGGTEFVALPTCFQLATIPS
jgi:hypothetical protein